MASSVLTLCSLLYLLSLSSVSHSKPILLPLSHSLSSSHFNSTHHLLKSSSLRSLSRHRRHRHLSLPLSSGTDYTLSLSLTSHHPISLFMDTGSDLVWLPCSPFQCILCEGKPSLSPPLPSSLLRKPIPCSSSLCSAAHSSLSSSSLCAISKCPLDAIETSDCSSFSCPPLYYAYGDGSLIAQLYNDSLSLPELHIRNFTFGCAHTALGEPTGVAGFGRGLLSLPNQLAGLFPELGTEFSYCLVAHSFDQDRVRRPSPLILGRRFRGVAGDGEFVYTSMLKNLKHPYFYSVGLAGISVGKVRIPAPEILRRVDEDGSGGVVVDSGTTFTMLPAAMYDSVVAKFDDRVSQVNDRVTRASSVEDRTGLRPCYYYEDVIRVPALTLHFAGENSSVVLPRRNYFYEFLDGGDGEGRRRKVGCLMLMNGGDEKELAGGPGATLGNYQQQGFEVVYDLENGRVGFARRQCGLLWDSLNRR